MKINAEYPSHVWSALVAAIGEDHDKIDQFAFADKSFVHDFVFTVDGVEFNFENIIESMHKSLDYNIECEAKRMFEDRLERLSSAVSRVTENMLEECERLLPNADWEHDEW